MLTADAGNLTDRHLAATGVGDVPIVVRGMENSAEFREVILEARRDDMDVAKIREEIVTEAERLVAENDLVGALVLECTDMPPFAAAIQERVRLPIFDLTTLVTMVHEAVNRQPYRGVNPRAVTG